MNACSTIVGRGSSSAGKRDVGREREVTAALVRLGPLLAPRPEDRARARRRLAAALAEVGPVAVA